MARALTPTLDAAMLGQLRQPDYRIEIFDVRSTSQALTPTTINDIVVFNVTGVGSLPTIVGPRDFSDDVLDIQFNETGGDYVDAGVAATTITFRVADPSQEFDPVENPPTGVDLEAGGRWMRQGNVVVVREGDLAVSPVDWPITFTGCIQGQPGADYNRTTSQFQLNARAASREVDFLRLENTTRNYLQGTGYSTMATEIAEVDMGLATDEIAFTSFGTFLTVFLSTQFVRESPLVSISRIMFPDGFMPRFLGNGTLGLTNGITTKGPARFYPASSLPVTITRPIIEANGVNEVEVLGLDPTMEKIIQAAQELASASITTGYFSSESAIPVRWSEDKTQQALDTRLLVVASIGDGIFSFGAENYSEITQTDGGSVEGIIDVDGALGASIALVYLLAVIFLATAFIPDGATIGSTIPIGRPINAIVGQILMQILGTAGRGDYRIQGRPFEYVFPEIREVARVSGLRSEDVQSTTIENHLVNSVSVAAASALRVLRRERAKVNARAITMLHDLRLEPDDIFEVGAGLTARRYMIQSITRTLARGTDNVANYNCFEVTPGVRP